ncbi:hypothetical protein BJ944DRAFT_82555 [Cunninghamella echinulata]|nr:hypothetical protein BJ944DRAFT_82555 [Cunninghamella echinulata]
MSNIYTAALEGQYEVVKQILENEPQAIQSKDEDDRTALHWAASGGHDELVLFLIEKNANVNAKDEAGLL